MVFNSLSEFIEMGGYGFYVWSCYGTVLTGMTVYYVRSSLSANRSINEIRKFYQRMEMQSSTVSVSNDETISIQETIKKEAQ